MSGGTTILIVDRQRTLGESLAADVRSLLGERADVRVVVDADGAGELADNVVGSGGVIPVAFVGVEPGEIQSKTVMELDAIPSLAASRNVLVTPRASLLGADEALRRGAIQGMITRPWTIDGLSAQLNANLAVFLVEHAPERLEDFRAQLDTNAIDQARERLHQHQAAGEPTESPTPFLVDSTISTRELEQKMLELLDRALGHPPRIRVAPGTILIESGDDIGGFYLVLDGTVRLTSRTSAGAQILHEQSTGAIIGLLSLATHRRAMLQCQAVTDVRAVPITLNQLAQALDAEPELAGLLTRVLISSLARRLRRSDELQMELDQSLADLSEARAQLVSSARFTALGEMAAGMAHELNNPAAALSRATEHLIGDVKAVISDPSLVEQIERHRTEEPLSTSDVRAARRSLTDSLGDRRLAEQMVDAGITSTVEAAALAKAGPASLDRLSAAARLGSSLRHAVAAGDRIQSLVGSLRAYVRGDDGSGPLVPGVQVSDGIEDALRLLNHRMGQVEVRRTYDSAPSITARPGALQQVWTNLFSNALDAMGDVGVLSVQLSVSPDRRVIATVCDTGPGIPAEVSDRIFEPRFTTKNGRVQFGLGLGLSISRQIVEEHGGTITVMSEPGNTCFTVELPGGETS